MTLSRLSLSFLGCTKLVIAHRLSTIRDADCILALENGRILESGNHRRLLKLNGYYAQQIASQRQAEKAASQRTTASARAKADRLQDDVIQKMDEQERKHSVADLEAGVGAGENLSVRGAFAQMWRWLAKDSKAAFLGGTLLVSASWRRTVSLTPKCRLL